MLKYADILVTRMNVLIAEHAGNLEIFSPGTRFPNDDVYVAFSYKHHLLPVSLTAGQYFIDIMVYRYDESGRFLESVESAANFQFIDLTDKTLDSVINALRAVLEIDIEQLNALIEMDNTPVESESQEENLLLKENNSLTSESENSIVNEPNDEELLP